MPKLSVVIPVYNVEGYLPQCIESVRTQRYRDIEIVCVNDGSTDRSKMILEWLMQVEPRVVVVSKENGGLSSARNAGISASSGEYVCFLDSDDMLEPEACGAIVEAFERTSADVVTYGASCYPLHNSTQWLEEVLSPRAVVYDGFDPDILFNEASRPFAWRTACKREFLLTSGIEFDETLRFGEDQVFHFALYPRSSKTALIPDKLVRYRVEREGSLMFSRGGDLFLKFKEHQEIVDRIFQDWRDAGILDVYGREVFLWSADFLLSDIWSRPDKERKILLDGLAGVWTSYFTESEMSEYSLGSPYRELVDVVLSDRSKSFGIQKQLVSLRLSLHRDGFAQFCSKLLQRFLSIGPFGALSRSFRRLVPLRSDDAWGMVKSANWSLEDAQDRQRALSMLWMELQSSRRRANEKETG